jgi:enterochelin esterase-like enzyme
VLPAPETLNLDTTEVWVYTPPGYDPTGKVAYPVAYLAHGSPGAASDWMAAGGPAVLDAMIARLELGPVIVVTPGLSANNTKESGCLNSTKPGGSKVETFLIESVIPWTQNHFPVATNRAYKAVGGMSMGGYCAVDQGLRHPDQFSVILSFMPYGDPGGAGDKMLTNQAEIDAVSPLKYISTLQELERYPVAAWFGVGDAEEHGRVGKNASAMAQLLKDKGQTAEVYIAPGQRHTWKMTIASFPDALRFWQRQISAAQKAGAPA